MCFWILWADLYHHVQLQCYPIYSPMQAHWKQGWKIESNQTSCYHCRHVHRMVRTRTTSKGKKLISLLFSWVPFQALTLQSALGGFLEFGLEMTEKEEFMHKKIMPYAISLGELFK